MALRTLIVTFLMASTDLISFAQSSASVVMLRHPLASSAGLVVADETGGRLFLQRGDSVRQLVHSPGCGTYFLLSPDGTRLGFKSISVAGQAPAVMDLSSNMVTLLHPPAPRVGQVSFARDGRCGFTVGDSLIVIDNGSRRSFDLGTYANLAPLSPDGNYAAYNNADDQLFLLSLSDGSTAQITDGPGGYALPQWSPDGRYLLYSSLRGDINAYDLMARATIRLGEGFGASWSYDSGFIVYYKKTVVNGILVNTDLFMVTPDGHNIRQLTSTPDNCEIDPSFVRDNTQILFQTRAKGEVYAVPVNATGAVGAVRLVIPEGDVQKAEGAVALLRTTEGMSVTSGLDIPYIHQVWDTPDWFNGNAACAPTTAMMLLAYYAVLPRWDVGCSGPSYHVSPWGRYICEEYSYRQLSYAAAANDPNGKPSYGGYGFMWASQGTPHSMMATYYVRHGLAVEQSPDFPPHSAAVAEINAGYPYSMCVGLTNAGHLVLAHGLGTEPHTLLFNDPYGNKNMTGAGYPNLYGKNVLYDWPGYNNGNQNLQNVFWCIAVHATVPAQADTLVDDAQLEHGFTLNTQAPASMNRWKDMNQGYNGHFWYCKTTGVVERDTCFAVWRPTLPAAGPYEISAYIQFSEATAARYRIYGTNECDTVVVNQKAIRGSWLSLGVHTFDAGSNGYVLLSDGAVPAGQGIVFDALRFSYKPVASARAPESNNLPQDFVIEQNYPNPFNPSTTIRYSVPTASSVRMRVVNTLGQTVSVLLDGRQSAGRHEIHWNAAGIGTGVYFCTLEASPENSRKRFTSTIKMVVIQ